jgi:hypothetical protein
MKSRKLLRQKIGFTLVGGSETQTAPAATPKPSDTPLPSQEFKIISAYEGMAAYVEAVAYALEDLDG